MKKLFAVAILAVTLCLAGLVVSGAALAQQCVDNGDGTVTDNGTGLMWQKKTAGLMYWYAADHYASSLSQEASLGGHSGWRLPSKDELVNLYHSPCKSIMHVAPTRYWSSTTSDANTNDAWFVDFDDGHVYFRSKLDEYRLRAVRTGQ